MALSHRLELRQGQGLVITPQLQQAIKLLQLSNIELDAFVEAELERNPLLQRDEGDHEPTGEVEIQRDASLTQVDAVADTAAGREMDAPADDVSPGERATGDGAEAEHAGGQIDWSRAKTPTGSEPCKVARTCSTSSSWQPSRAASSATSRRR